jgi:hypothetical protein
LFPAQRGWVVSRFTLLNECGAVPQPKDGLCGLFQQPCRSDVIDNPALDYTGTFEYRQFDATYRLTHAAYEPGYGCDTNLAVLVIQTGKLEQVPNVNVTIPNGVAIIRFVDFVSVFFFAFSVPVLTKPAQLQVIVYSDAALTLVNANCKCGGTWKKGEPRVLVNCPNDCSVWPELLGQPVMPVVLVADDSRIYESN